MAGWPRTHFLNFQTGLRFGRARQRFSAALADFPADVAVYHTEWGLPYFGDLDRSRRRVLYVHSDVPGLDAQVDRCARVVDGFICVSDRLAERVRQHAPDLSPERVLKVDAALEVPPLPARPARSPDAPLVLGFCGRVAIKQKRVDRFPELVRQLDSRRIPFRLEILGEGDELEWLRAQLQGLPQPERFRFHGRQRGSAYWEIVSSWDAILFVSDYEGTPLAELEAMAVGVVPFHPRLQSGGDLYAARVAPECVYEPGDLAGLAERLAGLRSQSDSARRALGVAAREAMSPHLGDAYRRQFTDYLVRLTTLPARAQTVSRGPRWGEWLTFGQREQLANWRRRWRKAPAR